MSGIKKSILRLTENVISLCKEVSKPSTPPAPMSDDTEMLKLKFEFMQGILAHEKDRDKTVEGKAAMFIGSTSLMGALLVGCFNIIKDRTSDALVLTMFSFCILVFFLMKSIIFSIFALRKRTYFYLAKNDIDNAEDKRKYYEGLIKSITVVIKHNQRNTNKKVDYMELAQRNFICFWISAFICVVFLCFYKLVKAYLPTTGMFSADVLPWMLAFIYGCFTGYLVRAQMFHYIQKEQMPMRTNRQWLKRVVAYI